MAMLTDEPMTETTTQPEPVLDGPVIVAPGAPGAIVQPATPADDAATSEEAHKPGIEGEETVWEGHYSPKNFLGRLLIGAVLSVAWIVVAINTWGAGHDNWAFWTTLFGVIVALYWVRLGYRFLRAHRGHHYRLTTRRLFVTTGFFHRRVDQLELIRIKDVYIQQSMIGDWMGIGNVVLISSEHTLPKAYLLGIEDPRRIMDLIWHHMRLEQAEKTNRVNPV